MEVRTKVITLLFVVEVLVLLPILAALRFGTGKQVSELSEYYYYDGGGVYFLKNDNQFDSKKKYLEGADLETFKVVGRRFGKDKQNVYFEAGKIKGADVATFRLLDKRYPMDKGNFFEIRPYDYHKMVAHPADMSNLKRLPGARFVAGDSIFGVSECCWENNGDEYQSLYFVAIDKVDSPIEPIGSGKYLRNGRNVFRYNDKVLEDVEIAKAEMVGDFCRINDTIYICEGAVKNKAGYEAWLSEKEKDDDTPGSDGYGKAVIFVVFAPGMVVALIAFVIFCFTFFNKFRTLDKSLPKQKWLLLGKLLTWLPVLVWPLVVNFVVFLPFTIVSSIACLIIVTGIAVYPLYLWAVADYGDYVLCKTKRLLPALLTLLAGVSAVAVYYALIAWIWLAG